MVVVGVGDVAIPKIRLLMKTEAVLCVYGEEPAQVIKQWAADGKIILYEREPLYDDFHGVKLVYCATGDSHLDLAVKLLAEGNRCLTCVVDDQQNSEFITPAIVDRDPVVVAIGTEGTAPVLARSIKARIEEMLSPGIGAVANLAGRFRQSAQKLPIMRMRREFWNKFFHICTPEKLEDVELSTIEEDISKLLGNFNEAKGSVSHIYFVGAGPGHPELLTLQARKILHDADVIFYDRLVSQDILELARREAVMIEVGKSPSGFSWKQDDVNDRIISYALKEGYRQIVRLKSGDPCLFGRLDEEIKAVVEAGVAFSIIPGVTAMTAASAAIGGSLTSRSRNSAVTLITGRDMDGFAEHDWKFLARDNAVFVVYMGVNGVKLLQDRLLLYGASQSTPVSVVENASTDRQRVVVTNLHDLTAIMLEEEVCSPAVIMVGIKARDSKLNGDVFYNKHECMSVMT